MGELHHECGVAALFYAPGRGESRLAPQRDRPASAARLAPRMLLDMQNRGQLAAGMTSYHPQRLQVLSTHKALGTVAEAFHLNQRPRFEALMADNDGVGAIGHVRYATCGGDDLRQAQPFEREHGRKSRWFAFAFNGQLANYRQLRDDLLLQGDYHLRLDTDTEIIMHHLSHQLADQGASVDWVQVFARLAERFDGAYNIVLLSATGELVVARDPLGIRPLCVAEDQGLFAAASESVPLSNLGFAPDQVRSLEPGTLMVINDREVRQARYASELGSGFGKSPKHCFFEWIYFANVASTLDDRSVYVSRTRLGQEMALLEDVTLDDDTIVVPVPDTAKAAADSLAYALKIRSVEGLMRNRYVGRTFIEGTADRAAKAKLKYTPLPEVLAGKRVLLVEDSIVRSTTMRALVHEIRERGRAREIHVRIACPPIIAPCFYGIDMSSRHELFAPSYVDEPPHGISASAQQAMAKELGADSLRYLSPDAIARSLDLPPDHLCRACVTGQYPTATGQALFQIDAAGPSKGESNGQSHKRTYERVAN